MTREVNDTLYVQAGPEVDGCQAFFSQVVTLGLLTIHLNRTRDILTADRAAGLLVADIPLEDDRIVGHLAPVARREVIQYPDLVVLNKCIDEMTPDELGPTCNVNSVAGRFEVIRHGLGMMGTQLSDTPTALTGAVVSGSRIPFDVGEYLAPGVVGRHIVDDEHPVNELGMLSMTSPRNDASL